MITEQQRKIILLSIFIISVFCASSQTISNKNTDGRYIIIENFAELFTDDGNQMSNQTIIIYNIHENESSKPIHVAVNQLNNVIDFSIKSNSENFENQRKCSIILKKESYKETFITALLNMDIKYVVFMGEKLNVDEFYKEIK